MTLFAGALAGPDSDAIVDATRLGFAVTADEARDLAVPGERICLAARAPQHRAPE